MQLVLITFKLFFAVATFKGLRVVFFKTEQKKLVVYFGLYDYFFISNEEKAK